MIWLMISSSFALPMYAQRSGRTCGNCHVSPTSETEDGWDNPDIMKRKCTMTCVSCHVDPTGGGLRNSSGRYYGFSTVSAMITEERSYSDHKRELYPPGLLWKWRQKLGKMPTGEGRTVPSDLDEAQQGIGAKQTGPVWVMGRHKKPVRMSFWDGRYGGLSADPVVQFGADLRGAFYSGTTSFFPMQADLHMAVHPVHHLTLTATGALKGGNVLRNGSVPVFARRAFVMLHELPGMSWVKAGAFQPAFGTLLDDHTAPSRTLFEGSQSASVNTVIGAEVGTAPNYPFFQASVFANDASLVGANPDMGWGAAAQGGYRELTWSLTAHAQIRRRQGLGRGDLEAAGIGWGWSPKALWATVPVTWLGEITGGRRTIAGRESLPVAGMSELSFLIRNGFTAKLRSDLWTPDAAGTGLQQRHGVGVVFSPAVGISFEVTGRMLLTPKQDVRTDLLWQTHIWL